MPVLTQRIYLGDAHENNQCFFSIVHGEPHRRPTVMIHTCNVLGARSGTRTSRRDGAVGQGVWVRKGGRRG